jgi:hypothetical protein
MGVNWVTVPCKASPWWRHRPCGTTLHRRPPPRGASLPAPLESPVGLRPARRPRTAPPAGLPAARQPGEQPRAPSFLLLRLTVGEFPVADARLRPAAPIHGPRDGPPPGMLPSSAPPSDVMTHPDSTDSYVTYLESDDSLPASP